MEHSVAAADSAGLERLLAARLEAVARAGGDPRAAEEPDRRDLDPATVPLVLIGAGSVIARPFVAHALARLNVVALVDNARAGTDQDGCPVIGDAGFAELPTRHPGLVGVMCCCSDRAVEHFTALWRAAGGGPVLSLFQAMRRTGVPGPDAFADPGVIADLFARRDLWEGFADEESRCTYLSLLLHRLSWDRRWIEARRLSYASMYFFTDAMDIGDDEVLVDGGAYDGDTVLAFAGRTGGRYRHIHAFEVDPANLEPLRRRVADVERVSIHPLGLWSGDSTLRLSGGQGAASNLAAGGAVEVPVRALDGLGLGPVSLIKLDIEGAEAAALEGAAATIRRHKPKLSLAVYHTPHDLASIADAVAAIRPDYRFRLRHHSPIFHDTVLYAE